MVGKAETATLKNLKVGKLIISTNEKNIITNLDSTI